MKHEVKKIEIDLKKRAIAYLGQLGNVSPTDDHISLMITILIASGLHTLIHDTYKGI